MRAVSVFCVALALAVLTAGCEEPKEVGAGPVSPKPSQLDAANAEIARLKQENAWLYGRVNDLEPKLAASQKALRQANARLKEQADALEAAGAAAATLKKLQGDHARLSAANENLKARLTKLDGDLRKAAAANKDLTAQLAQARKDNDLLKNKHLAAEQDAKKSADEMARTAKMVEALRQEVIQRDRRIAGLEMRLTGQPAAKAEPAPVWPNGSPAIQPAQPPKHVEVGAQLIQIRADQGRINAGSAMGVYRGMRMAVYRGPKFVAFFLVADVNLKSAGGFILGRKIDPRMGDKVISLPVQKPRKSR